MTQRDYLWCGVNLLLDQEEVTRCLCPACRAKLAEPVCPICGGATGWTESDENPVFDEERFAQLKRGETP